MSDQLNQLDAQIQALQQQKQALLESMRADALASTRNTVRQFGFTAQELGIASSNSPNSRREVSTLRVAKYRNPANPEQTWAGGKGAKPKWVRAHLEAGGTLDQLLIVRNF